LGNTINKLTTTECKVRDLENSLKNSKDSLGKATLNITRLSENLRDENSRYAALLEDSRKERNSTKISYESKLDKLKYEYDDANRKSDAAAKRAFAE